MRFLLVPLTHTLLARLTLIASAKNTPEEVWHVKTKVALELQQLWYLWGKGCGVGMVGYGTVGRGVVLAPVWFWV